ncbi:MAG: factor-independent urate hydroxylase [Planctomycetota bacterium]
MPATVLRQNYGKSRVRVSTIRRTGEHHDFAELACTIELMGDFDAAYTAADNALVVPTDTMKNTVYALAGRHGVESAEAFAGLLAKHMHAKYAHVNAAAVRVEQTPWRRLSVAGQPHAHSFCHPGKERFCCGVMAEDGGVSQTSGLTGLQVLKTTGSAFTGYHTDELTTLRPAEDRIFATTIDAEWPCTDPDADWPATRLVVREQLLTVFATHHSESVQHTLYAMAEASLGACVELDEISLTMPNQHHLLADLSPFGIENNNAVFVPTDEPYGNISATIGRGEAGPVD